MSGLARLMKAAGLNVQGSDSTDSALINALRKEGIPVGIGHLSENLPMDSSLLVYSEAVPDDAPERVQAREWDVPELSYFEALGKWTEAYRVVAIAGTHGKTTTTAMLGLILIRAGFDPTVLVGSTLREFENKNIYKGESEIFVVEACEYRRSFLSLKPALLGITNIDLDHLDYYKDMADYESAFASLASQSEEVIWPDENSEYEGDLALPGAHNQMNAGLAANMARRLGVSEEDIAEALAEFHGAARRFEFKGETPEGALIYDDYAHHPAEIQATLAGARERYPEARIVAVFQAHQYSRTARLLDDFAGSFEDADEVIIPNIYAARDTEEDLNAVSAEDLVEAISDFHENVRHGKNLEATAEYLIETLNDGDVVLVMGAGNIAELIPRILS